MKPLRREELVLLCEEMSVLRGAKLQELFLHETTLGFGFWHEGQVQWIWCDLNGRAPVLALVQNPPLRKKSQTKPVLLFLRANVIGQRLKRVQANSTKGRVVEMELEGGDHLTHMEFRLFPSGQNLLIETDGKRISWNKVKELPPQQDLNEGDQSVRTPDQIRSQWLNLGESSPGKASASPATDRQRAEKALAQKIDKLKKALAKVNADLERKRQEPWRQLGNWLVSHQSLEVPPEWRSYIDTEQTLAWNIENCFAQAKELERKLQGTEERSAQLQEEIESLSHISNPLEWWNSQSAASAKNKSVSANKDEAARGRTLQLGPEVKAFAGRSARDNLAVLRQSRAWDLWLHLRDYPSSHAVVHRPKNVEVSDELLRRVAQWMISVNFGAKAKTKAGEKFDVLVAECRYVRPMKGDSVGRVTYTNTRVFTVVYEGP